MEKHQKEILISQRANLVENINIRDGLFTQLIAKKILTQRMVRSIQNGRSYDEQIEALLDRLPQCGSRAFDMFCEALKEDFQEEIVTLYLKNDAQQVNSDTDRSDSVQESSSASTVSEDSVKDNGQASVSVSQAAAGPCTSKEGLGNTVGTGAVAVTEEYQQQIYRRSIEPGVLESMSGINGKMGFDQQDARYLYQNVLGNPSLVSNSVYSLLNNPGVTLAEKERILSEMSPSKFGAFRGSVYNNNDVYNFKDGAYSKEHLLSSPLLRSFQTDKYVHPDSPLKSQSTPFTFQTLERPPVTIHSSPVTTRLNNSEIHCSPEKHNTHSIRQNERDPSVLSSLPPHERVYSVASSSSPQQHLIGRDIREIPRHIEVAVPAGASAQREMMSLPRHVEMAQGSGQFPTSVGEELRIRGDYHNVQSLKRNDSVDTMHKGPLVEIQEPAAKRFRENIENIPTTPIQLNPLTFPDMKQSQALLIPVIDEARKQHSQASVVIETDRHLEMTQHGSLLGVMDDPEIDLTDGPINVKVDHSSRQFYLTYYKQAYKMRSIPRGKALIMNVNEVVGKAARRGTDIDRDNLHNMLCQLHFDVTVHNDDDGLTAKEMVLKLQDFSQHPGHKIGDCAVVCILSHGEEGYIFGADGKKFELDAVFSLFDNTCCESLRGKPKLFIIQACRGGALDRGVQYSPDEHDGSDARIRQVPSMSDMLICYPTQNGYYAWRNRDRGSWYVEALVHVFMKYAKCEDVCTMLNRVNLLVSKKVSHCPTVEMDQMSQMSEYKSTLRMPHFFFFPGIGGT